MVTDASIVLGLLTPLLNGSVILSAAKDLGFQIGPRSEEKELAGAVRKSAALLLKHHGCCDSILWQLEVTEMSKIERIARDVEALASDELPAFCTWCREFDTAAWDRQIEDDVRTGKLDALADTALKASAAGKCSDL